VKIGIDAHILGKNKGGVERYVKNLVELLPRLAPWNDYIIFISNNWQPKRPYTDNVTFCTLPISDPLVQRSFILPILSRYFSLVLLHVQRISPLWCPGRIVVTIHDLVQEKDPLKYHDLRNQLVRMFTPLTVRKASRVLTVSATIRDEIIKRFGLPAHKVVAVYNGIDHDLFYPGSSSNYIDPTMQKDAHPYILYVGAIEPRKNLEVVLKAFKFFLENEGAKADFLMVGSVRDKGYFGDILSLAKILGIKDHVIYKGYVSDDDCVELIRGARVFIAPSKYEGFDLPPLEAMACGTPVLTSNIPVHREFLSGAAVFFDPGSPEMLYIEIRKIWNNQEKIEYFRQRGIKQAKKFSWERAVWKIAQVYSEVGKNRTSS